MPLDSPGDPFCPAKTQLGCRVSIAFNSLYLDDLARTSLYQRHRFGFSFLIKDLGHAQFASQNTCNHH